jgi:hypothetical protein
MLIATMTFDRCDDEADWDQTDIYGLQEAVMVAMDKHFGGYRSAAEAQREYGRVRAHIEADAPNLFGLTEIWRAGLAAHPKAKQWEVFEREASAVIAPFCFSIQFKGD